MPTPLRSSARTEHPDATRRSPVPTEIATSFVPHGDGRRARAIDDGDRRIVTTRATRAASTRWYLATSRARARGIGPRPARDPERWTARARANAARSWPRTTRAAFAMRRASPDACIARRTTLAGRAAARCTTVTQPGTSFDCARPGGSAIANRRRDRARRAARRRLCGATLPTTPALDCNGAQATGNVDPVDRERSPAQLDDAGDAVRP